METTLEFSKITIEEVSPNKYSNEYLQARISQIVKKTTTYPTSNISNEQVDSVFSIEDFGENMKGQDYENEERRSLFIKVPLGSTIESVQETFDEKAPNGKLTKILSNHPILTEGDKVSISKGNITLDQKAEKQLVRFSVNHPKTPSKPITYNDKYQYRVIGFSATGDAEDVDLRTQTKDDHYIPESLRGFQVKEISETFTEY